MTSKGPFQPKVFYDSVIARGTVMGQDLEVAALSSHFKH